MAEFELLHNPRCRKSRETLQLLFENGIEPIIREYLKDPLNEKELRELLKRLELSAESLIRKNEEEFKTNYKGKALTETDWINAMVKYPKLMERPIVIKANKEAVIGRSPEKVLQLLQI